MKKGDRARSPLFKGGLKIKQSRNTENRYFNKTMDLLQKSMRKEESVFSTITQHPDYQIPNPPVFHNDQENITNNNDFSFGCDTSPVIKQNAWSTV